MLISKSSEKQLVLNKLYFKNIMGVLGVQKRPKTQNFGSKLTPPLVKKLFLKVCSFQKYTKKIQAGLKSPKMTKNLNF